MRPGSITVNAVDPRAPLKITLAWSDYQAAEAAAVALVNDLDLVVTAPDGAVYRGNVFGGGWSQTGGAVDRRNNVENVYIAGAAAGTWTVQVNGFNTPQGAQPYALVVDGVGGSAPTPTPTAMPTAGPTATPTATNTPAPALTVRVADLDGAGAPAGKNRWTATVTIRIVDGGGAAVAGAQVAGSWSNGASGNASCTTDGAGACSVTANNVQTRIASVDFTVTGVSKSGYTYTPGANGDPDGDSNGTTIRIFRP